MPANMTITGVTLTFDKFWTWIQAHPNCILRAGTPESVIFDDDDFAYTGTVLFHVIPHLSIGGAYTIADNADTWTAGLRFNF